MWTEFLVFSLIILAIFGFIFLSLLFCKACKWYCDQADKKEKERIIKNDKRQSDSVVFDADCSEWSYNVVRRSGGLR